jgi:hypothetical protein
MDWNDGFSCANSEICLPTMFDFTTANGRTVQGVNRLAPFFRLSAWNSLMLAVGF